MRSRIVAIAGTKGSGKTEVARIIAEELERYKAIDYLSKLIPFTNDLNQWRKDVRLFNFKYKHAVSIADNLTTDEEAKLVCEMMGRVILVKRRGKRGAKIDPKYVTMTCFNNGDLYDLRDNIRYLIREGIL